MLRMRESLAGRWGVECRGWNVPCTFCSILLWVQNCSKKENLSKTGQRASVPFSGKRDSPHWQVQSDLVRLFIEISSPGEATAAITLWFWKHAAFAFSSCVSGSSGVVGEFWGNLADTFPSNSWSQNSVSSQHYFFPWDICFPFSGITTSCFTFLLKSPNPSSYLCLPRAGHQPDVSLPWK